MPNPNRCSRLSKRKILELCISVAALLIFIASVLCYHWAVDGTIDSRWREISIFLIILSLSTSGICLVFAFFDRTPALLQEEDEPSFLGCGKIWASLKKCFCCPSSNEPENQNNEPPIDTTEELFSTDITDQSTTDTTPTQPKEEIEMSSLSGEQQAPSVSKKVSIEEELFSTDITEQSTTDTTPTQPKDEIEMSPLSGKQQASSVSKKVSIEDTRADNKDN